MLHKQARQESIRKRRNFFPTLLFTILLWVLTGGLVYFVEPDSFGAIPVLFILVFLALLFTASTIFANTRRGFITALGLTIFLFLKYLGVGNIINFLLIAGLGVTIEIYFVRR